MRSSRYIPFLLIVATPLAAQQPDTARAFTLSGRVVEYRTGAPVAHATVEIRELDRHTFADSAGRFVFADLPAGTYTFATSRLGYVENVEPSTVGPGDALIVRLLPRPVVLDGLEVAADRLEDRVQGIGHSVRAARRNELVTSAAPDVVAFVRSRFGVPLVPCRGDRAFGRRDCLITRGRPHRASVYLNDSPMPDGAAVLEHYRPHDLYRVEVFPSLGMIRIYTPRYIERAAEGGWNLPPICIVC